MRKSLAVMIAGNLFVTTSYCQVVQTRPFHRTPPPQPSTTQQSVTPPSANFLDLDKRAASGDANAGYLLGRIYETGAEAPGGKPDMYKALSSYSSAEINGSLNARYRNALFHTQGISLDRYTTPHADRYINRAQEKSQGLTVMQDAINHGYNPSTDALISTAHATAPPKASASDNALALLLLLGVAVAATSAASGSGTKSSTSASRSDLSVDNQASKTCTIFYTTRLYPMDPNSELTNAARPGYGYECP